MAIDSWDSGYGPEALIGAGSALLTPRAQGGGFAAVGPAILQARKAHQDGLLQKLYRQAQIQQLESVADEKKSRTALAKQKAADMKAIEDWMAARAAGANTPMPGGMVPAAPDGRVRTLSGVNPSSGGPPMPGPDDRAAINAMPTNGARMPSDPMAMPPAVLAAMLRNDIKPEQMALMADPSVIGRPEMKDKREYAGPDGSPMVQEVDKFGRPIGDPYRKPVEIGMSNAGDAQVGYNKFTGAPTGARIAINQSPDSKASTAVAWANHGVARANSAETARHNRFNEANPLMNVQAAESGLVGVNPRTLQSLPVTTADGKQVPAKMGEGAKKELSAVENNIAQAKEALKTIEGNPNAFGIGTGLLSKATGGLSIAGMDAKNQEARAFIMSKGAAMANDLYGAAQSASEMARAKSFIPQDTDTPEQLASKFRAMMKEYEIKFGVIKGGKPDQGGADNDPLGLRK